MAILAHEMLVNRIRTALAEKQTVTCIVPPIDRGKSKKKEEKAAAPIADARLGKDGAVQVKLGRVWVTLAKDNEVRMDLQYLIAD